MTSIEYDDYISSGVGRLYEAVIKDSNKFIVYDDSITIVSNKKDVNISVIRGYITPFILDMLLSNELSSGQSIFINTDNFIKKCNRDTALLYNTISYFKDNDFVYEDDKFKTIDKDNKVTLLHTYILAIVEKKKLSNLLSSRISGKDFLVAIDEVAIKEFEKEKPLWKKILPFLEK